MGEIEQLLIRPGHLHRQNIFLLGQKIGALQVTKR